MNTEKFYAFQKILKTLQERLDNLLTQLFEEKALLEKHHLDEIEAILIKKQTEFKSLNLEMAKLQDFLNTENLDFNASGIQPFIMSCPAVLQQEWQQFLNTLRNCQEQNLVNGLLVMGLKNYNDKLLSLLTHTPQTYGDNSKMPNAVSTREHKA